MNNQSDAIFVFAFAHKHLNIAHNIGPCVTKELFFPSVNAALT
jgi:hypothetical protein